MRSLYVLALGFCLLLAGCGQSETAPTATSGRDSTIVSSSESDSGPALGDRAVTTAQRFRYNDQAAKHAASGPTDTPHPTDQAPALGLEESTIAPAPARTPVPASQLASTASPVADPAAIPAPSETPPIDPPTPNTEAYESPADNAFLPVDENNKLSTFSIDVDTASYANVRRFLTNGSLPPKDAVRIEELLNYFTYSDAAPQKDVPFSVNIEAAECPWDPSHRLVRIGLKGKEIAAADRPVSNLVFLVDVSGSMQDANKLPLVKSGLKMLVDQLSENDRVSIVVYAGAAGTVLEPTTGDRKRDILTALENLQAGGSTNGGQGIELAYRLAREHLVPKGVNRVILCSDGDFNVGITDRGQLTQFVQEQAKSGVFLTVLGFGMGNYKDTMLEQLADKGNGNYGYIDTQAEARKLLVDQLQGTLVTIAKDVKIQVEFNPARVQSFRLIGYENRILAHQDFDDDKKDAGEIGSGHSVTALYEVLPAVDTPIARETGPATDGPLFTLRLRYKEPDANDSQLLEFPAIDRGMSIGQTSVDFRWSAAVAAFGMLLRDSPYKGNATLPAVLEMAEQARGDDKAGYRTEFLGLVRKAAELQSGLNTAQR